MAEMKPHAFERPINDGGCDRCGMGPEHRWHLEPATAQDLGERFEGERCKRHGEQACPSCLTYTVRDLQAEVRRLRAMVAHVGLTGLDVSGMQDETIAGLEKQLRDGRSAERERCAKVIDAAATSWDEFDRSGFRGEACRELAEQLRALPDEEA
jgi:hypothetical protein